MNGKTYTMFSSCSRLVTLLAATSVLFLLVGCAGGNFGRLDRDRDLDNMFLNFEILPDHRYYTNGGYDAPDAIMAVHRDYELDNPRGLWVAYPNVGSGQMRKWIDAIAPEDNYRRSNAYYAAYILDPDGKRIGAWYAIENFTTVKFMEGKKIEVYPPGSTLDFKLHKGGLRRGEF